MRRLVRSTISRVEDALSPHARVVVRGATRLWRRLEPPDSVPTEGPPHSIPDRLSMPSDRDLSRGPDRLLPGEGTLAASDTRAIAFYLPQFHPIPENDLWWGNGFTEWTNVVQARPHFKGHSQPHIPGELGFYDLRLAEVRERQAQLARRYQLHGFCYYYYWFNGRRLLERPLEEVLRTGKPDFPFCICWANENWTRRWDGAEHELLVEQVHTPTTDSAFIHDVLPIVTDPRYIRVGNKPILLVYRAGLLPDAKRTTETWREEARRAGIPGLHLCAVQSFGLIDPRPLGFDAAVEFPPHGLAAEDVTESISGDEPPFQGRVYDYRDAVAHALVRPVPEFRRYRGVMSGWDNTPRRGARGTVYAHSSPREYETWLRAAIAETDATLPPGERLVFINAWNEWAEGAHLEPDQLDGYAYLEATSRALRQRTEWRGIIRALRAAADSRPELLRQYATDLEFALEARERSLAHLARVSALVERTSVEMRLSVFSPRAPARLKPRAVVRTGLLHVDSAGGRPLREELVLKRDVRTPIEGWSFAPGVEIARGDTEGYLVLTSLDGNGTYFAPLLSRLQRDDVAKAHPHVDGRFTASAGFSAMLWCERVPAGAYRLTTVHIGAERTVAAEWSREVTVQ